MCFFRVYGTDAAEGDPHRSLYFPEPHAAAPDNGANSGEKTRHEKESCLERGGVDPDALSQPRARRRSELLDHNHQFRVSITPSGLLRKMTSEETEALYTSWSDETREPSGAGGAGTQFARILLASKIVTKLAKYQTGTHKLTDSPISLL